MANNNNFYGDSYNIQIQQQSKNSSQHIFESENFDYDKALMIANEIIKYKNEFVSLYGNSTPQIQENIDNILKLISEKKEPTKIKSLFGTIKDLTIGISGSLIASGIVQLISTIM